MDSLQNDPDLRYLSRQRFEYLEGSQLTWANVNAGSTLISPLLGLKRM